MILTLLISTVIAAAASVTPSGSVVTADNNIWMGVNCDAGRADSYLELYRSSDVATWGEPVFKVAEPGNAVSGGSLFIAPDGKLQLYYTVSSNAFDAEGTIYMRVCADPVSAPAAWGAPVQVGKGSVTSAPVLAADGSVLLPAAASHEDMGDNRGAIMYRSTDAGATWSLCPSVVNVPERRFADSNNPRIYTDAEGKVNMVCRSCDSGFLYRTVSSDNGASWSMPDKMVQNPHTDFALTKLRDGRLILVKNFRMDVKQFYCDRQLYAYLSEDGGESWYGGLRLTGEAFVGNPVVSENNEGDIFIACHKQNQDTSAVMIFRTTADEIDASLPYRAADVAAPAVYAFSAGRAKDAYLEKTAAYVEKRKQACPVNLRIGSYNIQRQGWGGGPKWVDRRESVFAEVIEHQWDILGTQEASEAYIKEIIKETGIKYDYVGNARQFTLENYRGGSEQFVIYRKDRFEPVKWNVRDYRINKDKFVGANTNGESFGADYYKATFWVKFYDKANDLYFYHVNLHYPVRTVGAQDAYSYQLREWILENCEGLPVIITGDFNCVEDAWGCRYLTESGFIADSMTSLPEDQRKNWEYYTAGTYRPVEKLSQTYKHVDHVFYTPSHIEILTWEVDCNTIHDGKYSSDHLPVTADLKFYK